jgi:hypothetical protein
MRKLDQACGAAARAIAEEHAEARENESEKHDLELIRALAEEEQISKGAVLALLEHSGALPEIAGFISDRMKELVRAAAVDGDALNLKFVDDYGATAMVFGQQNEFFKGLDGLIGPPNPDLVKGMHGEHCERTDSKVPFTTSNYGIETTSHAEYLIVVDPTKLNGPLSGMDARLPSDQANPTGARVPKPPSEFALKLDARNEQLEDIDIGKLCMQEFHAARLYTGPMFMKYNAVLRGLGEKGLPNSGKALEDRMTELCVDSRYVTTLHCINSAIVKLSRLAKPQTVYRGLSGRVLPSEFWRGQGHGGVEFAFMSTTADRKVAMQYAKAESEKAASCVMEVQMGMIDRGADLSWLSQYPDEHEITFPPYTGLEVVNTRVEGSVLVVELRLNVNLMSPTIEAAVAKMRSAHLQLLDIIHSNLRAANAPEQLLKSLKGLKGSEQGKEPDYFNRVQNFRDATEMALDTQHEGFLALHNKQLWEHEHEPHAIPEKMRLAAIVCARSGEHEVALSLLQQAWVRTVKLHGVQKAYAQITGGVINSTDYTDFHGHLRRLPSSLKLHNDEELLAAKMAAHGVEKDEEWKLRLAMHLVQSEIPAPWPATLCRLATPTDKMTLELSGVALRTNDATCDAIIAVIKAALEHQLAADNLGKPVGLPSLRKDAYVQVRVADQWRRAQADEVHVGSLITNEMATAMFPEPKEKLAKARTLKVIEPRGDQPPTIKLGKEEYQVQWTFGSIAEFRQGHRNAGRETWPAAGTYVITEVADGTVMIMHLDDHPFGKTEEGQKLVDGTASQLGGGGARFICPKESFLSVAMREGGGKREYSATAIARGEVLIMPAPNPTISSGAGALLREAAAAGNVKLLEALLDVGVSVWEADDTATTAVHLAAQNGQEETFKLLWSRPNPPKKPLPKAEERAELVGPTLTFTRPNSDGKRALNFIFENGRSKLARMTRAGVSDMEMERLEEEEPEALKWTVRSRRSNYLCLGGCRPAP